MDMMDFASQATARLMGALTQTSRSEWAGIVAALIVSLSSARVLYNLYFHPLRSFPGPLLYRATTLAWCWSFVGGRLVFDVLDMHARYGPIVRIRPDELSFADPRAWQDIYGHKGAGKMAGLKPGIKEVPKYHTYYKHFNTKVDSIVTANTDDHAMLRRLAAPGFSDRTMRGQEPIIGGYIDLLMQRLRENAHAGAANMTQWYNWTTFDIIGDLAFGESFHCLDDSAYKAPVRLLIQNPKDSASLVALRYLGLRWVALLVLFTWARKGLVLRTWAKETLIKRLNMGVTRPDLIEPFLEQKEKGNLTFEVVRTQAAIFMVAGSETTASVLTGVTYLLLAHPEYLARVTEEVRSSFKSESEITLDTAHNLPFMIACLTEALRFFPPAATGFPRIIPEGGATISGAYVPENTIVAVHTWVSHHSGENWVDSFEYRPERWLGDDRYAADRKEAYKPFSFGPRDCVGKNLAYLEMRLILARMLWNFDMTLDDSSRDWIARQQCYVLWKKLPLNVHITPVNRA